ncbi:MAG TPA: MBL fold metallo-hydrolase, partial [Clostridiaceae bacterium]|nr:MBL fold metallo-hydrolase [Clostridiaceae bacterium]
NDGTHVMIDGGVHRPEEDEEYSIYNSDGSLDPVYSYIKDEMSGRVDLWLVTHFHDDHFGNAADIFQYCKDISIGKFVGVLPTPEDHMEKVCYSEEMQAALDKIIEQNLWQEVRQGDLLEHGELQIEVMHDLHQVSKRWSFNDTTTIFRLHLGRTNKNFIVLGDLYEESGRVFMANHSRAELKSDIVSVAHHGIKGVDPIIYDRIQAPIAFVPSFLRTYRDDFWLNRTKPAVSRWAHQIIHGVEGTYSLRL